MHYVKRKCHTSYSAFDISKNFTKHSLKHEHLKKQSYVSFLNLSQSVCAANFSINFDQTNADFCALTTCCRTCHIQRKNSQKRMLKCVLFKAKCVKMCLLYLVATMFPNVILKSCGNFDCVLHNLNE